MLKYGKDFNFLKYKRFKQIEVFTSTEVFSVIHEYDFFSHHVQSSGYKFVIHRSQRELHAFLAKGSQKKYLQGANILYVQINYSGLWRCVEPAHFF